MSFPWTPTGTGRWSHPLGFVAEQQGTDVLIRDAKSGKAILSAVELFDTLILPPGFTLPPVLLPPVPPVPVGIILPCATDTPDATFLECNGAAVSRVAYADLFARIGTRWGIGDGSTTFNVPDLRGQFLRGWDHGAGIDPESGSRSDSGDGTTGDNVGTAQGSQFGSHVHYAGGANFAFGSPAGGPSTLDNGVGGGLIGTNSVTGAGGSETRPVNKYVMYQISAGA